jgi:hypothetical protein
MREAVRCCLLCRVRPECLNQALSYGLDVEGIWAATTPTERRMTAGLPLDARLSWLETIARAKASEVLTKDEAPAA